MLIGAGALVAAVIVGLGIPFAVERWGVVAAAALLIVFTPAAVLALNVCGWLFVGWELAAGQADAARPEQRG